MPGKLVHTNEITVLLGDNWFAKCSAKQAQKLVEHRKKRAFVLEAILNFFRYHGTLPNSDTHITNIIKKTRELLNCMPIYCFAVYASDNS